MKENTPNFDDVLSLFTEMPIGQLVFLLLFMATWLIGVNILVAFHYKRMGKHWATVFKLFSFPLKDFNAKEWFSLFALAVVAMAFGIAGISYGK